MMAFERLFEKWDTFSAQVVNPSNDLGGIYRRQNALPSSGHVRTDFELAGPPARRSGEVEEFLRAKTRGRDTELTN